MEVRAYHHKAQPSGQRSDYGVADPDGSVGLAVTSALGKSDPVVLG